MGCMRWTSHVVAACATLFVYACGTGDTRVDPGDLELRDLLGVAPETAARWSVDQRESARRVLLEALDDRSVDVHVELAAAPDIDEQVRRSLAQLDTERFAAGEAALGLVRAEVSSHELAGTTRTAPMVTALAAGDAAPAVTLALSDQWGPLPPRSHEVLAALAVDAGHTGDSLVVVPAPRLTVIASYVAATPPHLVVNPVVLAALDPGADSLLATTEAAPATGGSAPRATTIKGPGVATLNAGNPYSFYGSVAECAYAQRTRCEACLPTSNCEPITTTSDGNAECTTLGESDGRGYYLICINLALAIHSVADCTADAAGGCTADTSAASELSRLDVNARFLDDASCGSPLDRCLADIYGAPSNTFPGVVDGGVEPPPSPPRETDVSCGDSCDDNKSSNCEFSPSCDCSGPSCGNSFSCESSCSNSNTQSGCGDNCDSCSSSSSSGSSGGGCSSSSSGGSSGGDCGGGDCGGGDCGGGCQVVKRPPNAAFAVGLSMTWALLPVPFAAALRRRARRKRGRSQLMQPESGTSGGVQRVATASDPREAGTSGGVEQVVTVPSEVKS